MGYYSSKTELIFFHKPNNPVPDNYKIKLNGTKLYHTNAIKYLGIYLDEPLSGSQHCYELSKKLSRANGMLAKSRHYAPEKILSIYHALFSSQLKYGSQIWGQYNNTYVNAIFTLQKTALRIISFSNFRAHCSPLLKKNHILKLEDHITLENCLLVHDYLKSKLPTSFDNYFTTTANIYTPDVTTRNSKNGCLFVPSVNSTKYGLNSIKIKAIVAWNCFIKIFKNLNLLELSRSKLKANIKSHFLDSS